VGPAGSTTGEIVRLGGDPPSPWEEAYSFSRLVRAGGWLLVGGTTSVGVGGVIVGKLEHELARGGATLADVVQTRVYVTDITRADEVGRAHAEVFGSVRPLMTMIEVSALIDPRMLVEMEAAAVVGSGRP
jgi:enamine deaminase RidA (YjgF/YER057c/UK114 family)